ncbi:MAG: glycosyltransferase family 4 protein [Halobacteria archaeon]
MEILFIWDSFPPEVGGGAAGGYALVGHLARLGHRVHVVTKKYPSMMAAAAGDYPVPEGSTVTRCAGMSLPSLFPGAGYVPNFARAALRICRERPVEVIHGSSPNIGNGVAARLVSRATGVPFVFGARDPWVRVPPPEGFDPGRSGAYIDPRTPGGRARWLLEEWVCRGAPAIAATNPAIRDELAALHPGAAGRIEVIYNGAELDEFQGVEPKRFDRFTVFYSGVLYKDRSIGSMVEAVSRMKGAQLLVTGQGPPDEMPEFRRLMEAAPNVRHLGILPRRELAACLLGADVLYVSLGTYPMNRYLLPSKLFTYMAAGRPVLATGLPGGDLERILRQTGCGLFVPSEDPGAIGAALERLRDPALARRLGESGRRAAEREFNRESQARKMAALFEKAGQGR